MWNLRGRIMWVKLFSVKDLGPHQLYHNPDIIRNEKRGEVWDEVRQLGFHIKTPQIQNHC